MVFNRKKMAGARRGLEAKAAKRVRRLTLVVATLLIAAICGGAVVGASAAYGVYTGILEVSPDIGTIDVSPKGFSTFVYDNTQSIEEGAAITAEPIATLVSTDSNRVPVGLDGVSENLMNAFVAIEDERFYRHRGIDIPGIFRAIYVGVKSGLHFSEGASTITQQLIKNNVFTDWTNESDQDRVTRKVQEQYLAYELEKTMPKPEILLNYLNTINLGHNTLGVEAASQRYFNKRAVDLTLAECAVLAAIPQNPTAYDPIEFPENNRERQEVVLEHMLAQGYIGQEDYSRALAEDVYAKIEEVNVDKAKYETRPNSYFVDALIRQVLRDLQDKELNGGREISEDDAYRMLYSGGLQIFSTQDPKIQQIVDRQCAEDSGNFPDGTQYYLNYALTVTKPDGTQTNYDSNSLQAYFGERDEGYSILYTSRSRAKEDIEAFRKHVMEEGDTYDENYELAPQPEISVTVADQKTGYVVAMLGGRGEKTASRTLNRATDTTRQPGSTFKIVSTFAAALDSSDAKDRFGNRYTLASTEIDEKYNYDNGKGPEVHNWYEGYRGVQTIRAAIQDSLNVIAVKTLTRITSTDRLKKLGFSYAEKMGINTLVDDEEINGEIFSDVTQTLALGGITYGVRNIELNAAFSTIANGGEYIVPRLYTKVLDLEGNVLLCNVRPGKNTDDATKDRTTWESERVLKQETCWLLTNAMKDVLTKGTGMVANFTSTEIAGKTGTTEESNDVWFAGYSPNYTATVWAGYDNNTKLSKEEESLAMVIWRQVMSHIPANKKSGTILKKPNKITTAVVCRDSGLLAVDGYCNDHAYTEYFVKGTAPTTYCPTGTAKKQKAAEKKKKKEEEERRKREEEEEAKKKAASKIGNISKKPGNNRDDDDDDDNDD